MAESFEICGSGRPATADQRLISGVSETGAEETQMVTVLKLIGVLVLAAVALLGLAFWDVGANGGRLFAWLAGRGELVEACTPPLRESLVGKGFSPVDIALGEDQAVGFSSGSFGRSRSLSGSFTFSDGQDGPRIDGHVLCTVGHGTVQVDVDVNELPRRLT